MSNQIASTTVGSENVNSSELQSASKGKGKAVDNNPQDMSMDEDDDSSDEETGAEEEACWISRCPNWLFNLSLTAAYRPTKSVR